MAKERRVKFTKTKHSFVFSRRHHYKKEQRADGIKPVGLWYSREDDFGWSQWCIAERFRVEDLRWSHELEVDTRRILQIQTVAQLDRFHKKYVNVKLTSFTVLPDWEAVRREYAGIEISPYQWSRRLSPGYLWYYGWDCASGCVWDLSAIKRVGKATKNNVKEMIRALED